MATFAFAICLFVFLLPASILLDSVGTHAYTLPIIDLSEGDEEIATKLGHAATTMGFFYLIGHNVSRDLRDQVFDQAKRFFALDESEKIKYKQSSSHNGYTAFEAETLDLSKQEKRGDTKEGYYILREIPPDDPYYGKGLPQRLPNQWPNESLYNSSLVNWKSTMLEYYNTMHNLGNIMNGHIAESLNLDKNYFESCFDRPLAALRLLHYSNELSNISNGIYGCGAHTDYGMLTFLLTDGKSGLQILDKSNKSDKSEDEIWMDVPYVENAYVVNIGDELQRWTNDLYKSTLHRVISVEKNRYSVAYFWEPNFDCMVECLPTVCDENTFAAKHPPIKHGIHLLSKFEPSYGKTKKEL